jgi:DNA repair protein RadC
MQTDDEIIQSAMRILQRRASLIFQRDRLGDTTAAANYFILRLHAETVEHLDAMFLDEQFGIICVDRLSSGTKGTCAVYPRNVVKRSLELNATHVILAHNHSPSKTTPSQDDLATTDKLKAALEAIDVALADHIIVFGDQFYSMREHGDI